MLLILFKLYYFDRPPLAIANTINSLLWLIPDVQWHRKYGKMVVSDIDGDTKNRPNLTLQIQIKMAIMTGSTMYFQGLPFIFTVNRVGFL